jgi:hypothetical protein
VKREKETIKTKGVYGRGRESDRWERGVCTIKRLEIKSVLINLGLRKREKDEGRTTK